MDHPLHPAERPLEQSTIVNTTSETLALPDHLVFPADSPIAPNDQPINLETVDEYGYLVNQSYIYTCVYHGWHGRDIEDGP